MELFYFGSVCSHEIFNVTVEKSKVKPSASAQNFESALIKGFAENETVNLTVASAESIAMFPNGNRLLLKKRQDVLDGNAVTNILPAINLPLIKQINHANGAAKLLKKWIKSNENKGDKCVLVYGIYPKVVQKLQKICKKNGCKIFAVITDVPSTMFTYTKSKSLLKKLFSGSYREMAISLQDKFDGYVYLTEAMNNKVAPSKPYTVVETIADTAIFDGLGAVQKSTPSALMYAGALYEKYGLKLILDTFESIKTNCELWLFGTGDYEKEIARRAEKNPKIKFFGRVSRNEVLQKEQEATLLLNLRKSEDEYTKYSFPSKMIEYMLSGTPVFTTKLPGIPDEYDAYCYTTTVYNAEEIATQIDKVLWENKMSELGEKARSFVKEQKNSKFQANKIIEFLKKEIMG